MCVCVIVCEQFAIKYDAREGGMNEQTLRNNGGVNESDAKNEKFSEFVDHCSVAYEAVRKRSGLFFSLFRLMLPSQMPELISELDVTYLKRMLHLHVPSGPALRELIETRLNASVNDEIRILDNMAHDYVHSK